jgi:fucose 4-O-acetylase-like acetyltransferase
MKQRIDFIDLAKGICILLVVQIHVYGDTSVVFFKMMSLFRMPLYFVLSGLFFKTYEGFFPLFKKKTNKLLVPFFFVFFITILPLHFIFDYVIGDKLFTLDDLLFEEYGRLYHSINGAVWFLFCLFQINLYFYFIVVYSRLNNFYIILFSCISGLIGYSADANNYYFPLWIDSSLTALPFFVFGYEIRRYTNILHNEFSIIDIIIFLISLIILVGVYSICGGKDIFIGFDDNHYRINILGLYLGGISGTMCILMVAKYLNRLPIVSYIGRYSIIILSTHLLYIFFARNLFFQLNISQDDVVINTMLFVVVVIISIPTISFARKYLPYCFAQKDLWK